MSDEQSVTEKSDEPVGDHPPELLDPVNPDKLLGDFKGKPLLVILLVVLVLHAVLIGAISAGGALIESALGGEPGAEELDDDQRMEKAIADGETELRKIAGQYDVSFRDLKAKLSKGSVPAPSTGTATPAAADTTTPKPDQPASEYEKDLNRVADDAPPAPDLSGGLEEEDDIAFPPDAP